MSLDVYLHTITPACSCCGRPEETVCVFDANITHNLNTMAEKAGIYKCIWYPEELGITKAKELIIPLQEGLADLKKWPEHYKMFGAANGWGTYKDFIPWVEDYLQACIENPDAEISTST